MPLWAYVHHTCAGTGVTRSCELPRSSWPLSHLTSLRTRWFLVIPRLSMQLAFLSLEGIKVSFAFPALQRPNVLYMVWFVQSIRNLNSTIFQQTNPLNCHHHYAPSFPHTVWSYQNTNFLGNSPSSSLLLERTSGDDSDCDDENSSFHFFRFFGGGSAFILSCLTLGFVEEAFVVVVFDTGGSEVLLLLGLDRTFLQC